MKGTFTSGIRLGVLFILLALSLACGSGRLRSSNPSPTATATLPMPADATQPAPSQTPEPTAAPPSATPVAATQAPSPSPSPTQVLPENRIITVNDFVPEQRNFVDTAVVLVDFSDRTPEGVDMAAAWEHIFGVDDPQHQLNAYYNEIFYGQLELRPLAVEPDRYITVELPGVPQDYSFGWLIGMETEELAQVDPEVAVELLLEIMSRVVQQQPSLDYQDTYFIFILNATGSEYGRAAAGVLPTAGTDPVYDMFIGAATLDDEVLFSDPAFFRVVDTAIGRRAVGLVRSTGYTFADYFRDRGQAAFDDQFVRGMALFGQDGELSCAVHDILHGLRRKSAYAMPPEGRARAVNCLYNLPLQSTWVVGTDAHGHFDRGINVSPYIGWWDAMGDHLHAAQDRSFFGSYPQGMSAYTRLRMGMIPERCIADISADTATVRLATLSAPALPAAGASAETLAVRVPLIPDRPEVEHIYLLLEYRSRAGADGHPDAFSIAPDFARGDPRWDPGLPAGHYANPPDTFVSKEGVLVYLVNEKMTEEGGTDYAPEEWYRFVLVLLNPAGNDRREDLTQAPLAAGESLTVDMRTLYSHVSIPVTITISVTELTPEYAEVQIIRD